MSSCLVFNLGGTWGNAKKDAGHRDFSAHLFLPWKPVLHMPPPPDGLGRPAVMQDLRCKERSVCLLFLELVYRKPDRKPILLCGKYSWFKGTATGNQYF